MFCEGSGERVSRAGAEGRKESTHLRANLQYIFEPDTRIGELALQHHDDVVVVLRDLLRSPCRVERVLGELLQLSNLLVESGDVLLDDVGEFLPKAEAAALDLEGRLLLNQAAPATHADLDWPVIKQGFALGHCNHINPSRQRSKRVHRPLHQGSR